MRILLIVDPDNPVPPIHYGGTERVADLWLRSGAVAVTLLIFWLELAQVAIADAFISIAPQEVRCLAVRAGSFNSSSRVVGLQGIVMRSAISDASTTSRR